MGLGYPFQGDIVFWAENSYGTGASAVTLRISDKVNDVRIDSGAVFKTLRGISSPSVCAFISQPSDPTLHVEWVLQSQPTTPGSLSEYCVEKDSTGDLQSLAFAISANDLGAVKSYYMLSGCKCKTWNISASRSNEYICTADFSVQSVVTSASVPTAGCFSMMADNDTQYAVFNVAQSIVMTTYPTAFITDSINITVEHNLKDEWDCDSLQKVASVPGATDVSGAVDISLDDGGAVHWGRIVNNNELTSIVIDTGIGGTNEIFNLNYVHFDSTGIGINQESETMMSSVPFTAKDLSIE